MMEVEFQNEVFGHLQDLYMNGEFLSEKEVHRIITAIDRLHFDFCTEVQNNLLEIERNESRIKYLKRLLFSIERTALIGFDGEELHFTFREVVENYNRFIECLIEIETPKETRQEFGLEPTNPLQLTKLKWNGNKNQLYWLLRKLKETQGPKGEPLVTSGYEDLAVFIKQSIAGFENTAHVTIQDELGKKNELPAARRIDLTGIENAAPNDVTNG